MYYHPGFQAGYPSRDSDSDSQIGPQTRQTQYYPSSDDQRLPATFYNDLDNMFPGPSFVPPPPVPAAGQSLSNHLATSHPVNLPPSLSFADHPLFSDPSTFATREGRNDHHSSVTVRSGEGPPVSFPSDPFYSNPSGFFEPSTSQYDYPFSGPSHNVGPHVDSVVSYHPSFAAYFDEVSHAEPQDVLSVDGICTMPAGSEDVPALNESLPLNGLHPGQPCPPLRRPSPDNDTLSLPTCQPGSRSRPSKSSELQFHPYSRSAQLKLRGVAITKDIPVAGSSRSKTQPSRIGPLLYDGANQTHKMIFEIAQESRIKSALNVNPFLSEQERKAEALAALTKSACKYDKDYGEKWAHENLGEFYKSNPLPCAEITTTCKKIARPLVQRGYALRPSVWLRTSEPTHQMQMVQSLLASFPPEFIFGKDEFGRSWPFEHYVVLDVVLNTVVELGYLKHLTDLKALFCTASAAVQCALNERSGGGFKPKGFVVSQSKPMFDSLMTYIQEQILTDVELAARWEEYEKLVFDTLKEICK